MTDLLTINNLVKHFPAEKKIFGKQDYVHAVNNVSLEVREGETFSVVGESGCGKSTVSRLINHLIQPDSGEIWFDGTETAHLNENEFRPFRQHMQMIFQ
ncbi:MAG TPA: ATP-binding cassette domain-containing protein, partial [Flexilinea sp.]|nr:ATP-binding cassette domain-containing protein [Flexilinea sp.]